MGIGKENSLFRMFVAAAAFGLLVSPVSSQSYICEVRSVGDGFIPEQLGMNIDVGRKSAIVFDAFVNWAYGKPTKARVRRIETGELEIRWALTLPTSPIQARVRYRVVLNEQTKAISIRGSIRNATNVPAGKGQCVIGNF